MRKISRNWIFVIILLLLWGCAGPRYYDLYVKPEKKSGPAGINKILRVEDVHTGETYWYRRIPFRKSSYKVQYFTFQQWAKTPGELIKDSIIYFYKNSGFFKKVTDIQSSIDPDIIMKVQVDALEMLRENRQWFARLALDIEFVDSKTDKAFLTHYFNRKSEIKGRRAGYLPEKISRILKEELLKIVEKLKQPNIHH